jgi:hypothetical protein
MTIHIRSQKARTGSKIIFFSLFRPSYSSHPVEPRAPLCSPHHWPWLKRLDWASQARSADLGHTARCRAIRPRRSPYSDSQIEHNHPWPCQATALPTSTDESVYHLGLVTMPALPFLIFIAASCPTLVTSFLLFGRVGLPRTEPSCWIVSFSGAVTVLLFWFGLLSCLGTLVPFGTSEARSCAVA